MNFGNTPRYVAVILAAALIITASPMTLTVSADDNDTGEDSVIDTLFTDEDEDGDTGLFTTERAVGFARGVVDRYSPLSDDSDSAEADEYAADLKSSFNQNNGQLSRYANERTTATEDFDVIRLKVTDESENTEWLFLAANVTGGNYTNATMMNQTEFEKSERQYDATYRLSPFASRNAAAELDSFVTEFAEPNKSVTDAYGARMFGKYRGEITGDDLPGEDQ